jgi:hypothetical protein
VNGEWRHEVYGRLEEVGGRRIWNCRTELLSLGPKGRHAIATPIRAWWRIVLINL